MNSPRQAADHHTPATPATPAITLVDICFVVFRRKWLILTFVVLGPHGGRRHLFCSNSRRINPLPNC